MVFSPNMQIGCLDWFRVKPSIMPENRISAILFYRIDANRRRFFFMDEPLAVADNANKLTHCV
jgi:hypothetical protein